MALCSHTLYSVARIRQRRLAIELIGLMATKLAGARWRNLSGPVGWREKNVASRSSKEIFPPISRRGFYSPLGWIRARISKSLGSRCKNTRSRSRAWLVRYQLYRVVPLTYIYIEARFPSVSSGTEIRPVPDVQRNRRGLGAKRLAPRARCD